MCQPRWEHQENRGSEEDDEAAAFRSTHIRRAAAEEAAHKHTREPHIADTDRPQTPTYQSKLHLTRANTMSQAHSQQQEPTPSQQPKVIAVPHACLQPSAAAAAQHHSAMRH